MDLSISCTTLASFRRRTRVCVSQESSYLEKKEERRAGGVRTVEPLRKEKIVVPGSPNGKPETITPLVTALKTAADQNAVGFHFPGHNRGHAAPSSLRQLIGLSPYFYDTTELPLLGNLFSGEGPIAEAQKEAAKLFGASETWFLVGGTSCGIIASIMATCSPGDYLILPRNCHISANSGLVLSGAVPKYLVPDYDCEWDIPSGVTPAQVEKAIKELAMEGRKPAAVMIISPTYHGVCSDLRAISNLCHLHGIPLIVDEAHGAHFKFHPMLPDAALEQGADIVIQSTHKVLCSLTQASMLHMSGNLVDKQKLSICLRTLQSTSPSYLLLGSLDATRAQLSEVGETIIEESMNLAIEAKRRIRTIPGVSVFDSSIFPGFPEVEPFRLTVGVWKLGLSGYEADELLNKKYGVLCELDGSKSLTLVMNIGTRREHIERLIGAIEHLSETTYKHVNGMEKQEEDGELTPFLDYHISLNPREAFFAPKRKVSIKESIGKICGELICPFPPGIAVMVPGEIITESALHYLQHVRKNCIGASDPLLDSITICDV